MPNKAQDDDLVISLVELALTLPEDDREAYLLDACSGDAALFSEVWNYVQWEQRMNGFLLEPLYTGTSSEHPFEPGQVLENRFHIVREIAQGGMGVVYEALDQRLERRIALKCAKVGFHNRLPPEVRHATAISHPNVCKIFEIHTASTARGEIDFLTMEFLEGATLAERISHGPLAKSEALSIARELCAGLAEAHRNQVIHGDLKSNNIILATGSDGVERPVITDFGLARRLLTKQSQSPSPVENSAQTMQSAHGGGAPDYMAPELLNGERPSAASDVYALGVILCELFSGKRPFAPDVAIEDRPSCKLAGLDAKWERIVARCLDPDPSGRFQDAAEVAQAIAPRSRRMFLWVAAAALLAAFSGVVTYQRVAVPKELLRLAILPFESDADLAQMSEGLLQDSSDRLSRVKASHTRRLTVIPLSDALQHQVYQPAKARSMLGATHALHGVLRKSGERIHVAAYITATDSAVNVGEWQGDYSAGELGNMPVALAGMVTGTLRLPPLPVLATVNAAAYADYSAGVALLSRSTGVDPALPLLERAVAADPNSVFTHAKLAEAQWMKYLQTKDPRWQERAIASLHNAEQRNPDVVAVRFLSGLVHQSFGQYGQAEADLLRAIELEPNNGAAWRWLGKVYEDGDQPTRALTAALKAIEVQPGYFKNYQNLGAFYFNRGDYENAQRQYKEMVRLAPDLAEAHYALAAPYLNMGKYADAESELNLAIGYHETANAVLGLGLSRMYQGRDIEAIPYFQRAIQIGPPASLFYINLGTVLRRANFPEKAKQAYQNGLDLAEAALSQNPKNGYEEACLAYLCARLGDPRRARSEAARALQISGKAVSVRWMAALTYEALEDHEQTLSLIEDAPATLLDRLNRFPDLADLRANPRFQQLLGSHQIH